MENNLDKEQIISGYEQFSKFISKDINKHLLINTIENCIKGIEWPESYYSLRDDFLPSILGDEASNFFFWSMFGGLLTNNNWLVLDEDTEDLLRYSMYNYALKFVNAKKYNLNPLGFNKISFTHGSEKEFFNTYILRNDSEKIVFRMDTDNFSELVTEMLDYYSQMIDNDVVDFSEQIQSLEQIIDSLDRVTNRLKNKLTEETNNE